MSLCDICIRPGACCEGFPLSCHTSWVSEGIGGPLALMLLNGLPFLPTVPKEVFTATEGADRGRTYQTWFFRCTNLLPNGRCGDY